MTKLFTVIPNLFLDLIGGRPEGKKARGQAVICEQSSRKVFPLSRERVSEGQERVNRDSSLIPTLSPSLIREGDNIASLFTSHFSLKQKPAFTLAEVLITLGIIGVVAAMTMPSLIANYKYKVLENQLKAAYSDLNQAAKLFQVHNGMSVSEYTAENASSINAINEFSKFFNTIKDSNLRYNSTDSDGNSVGAAPYKWHSMNGSTNESSNCDVSGFFWDTQGRVISFDDPPSYGQNGPKVCIDINGEKGPNRYGVDYFIFIFTTDGYVIPYGQEHPNNPAICSGQAIANCISSSKCSYSGAGNMQFTCSIYALSNQHPTDSGKDYWHDFVRGN